MPYQDSPGWERQWNNFSWEWDFHVSTVSEGHRSVNDKEKLEAKSRGAKLTFGEVLDCGVLRMLHNLGADKKSSFHDLGMGPGKMLIQTYLHYSNLKICMGVELAKGRYELAERNIRTLLKNGWRGRKFLGIEFKSGHYFKIVEDVQDKSPKNGWNIGDKVIAYYPGLKQDKFIKKDYHAIITNIKKHKSGDMKKTLFTVEYDDGTTCDRIQDRYLFIPGKERTCEVWHGSLFDYPGGFDAEICVLETDFPEERHPHLMECMLSTPIGCTFFTYHDLKKFKCYDWDNFRQIDCNIYDNDRYITSWSQGWRFYLWEHVPSFNKVLPYNKIRDNRLLYDNLHKDDQIIFRKKNSSQLHYGEILTINKESQSSSSNHINLIVRSNKIEIKKVQYQNITISSRNYSIYKSRHRFRIGQEVSAYFIENLKDNQYQNRFEIYRGKIIAVDPNKLSYVLRYIEEGKTMIDVSEKYIYKLPKLLYSVGDNVMACWPRNAQNKNCPQRYKRFPAEIIDINNDATYRCKYSVSPYLLSLLKPNTFPDDYRNNNNNNNDDDDDEDDDEEIESKKQQNVFAPSAHQNHAESVREMWIQYPANFVVKEIQKKEKNVGYPFYVKYNAENVETWNVKQCIEWITDIGLSTKLRKLFELNQINGKIILNIRAENDKDLLNELNTNILTKKLINKNKENNDLHLNRIELRNLLSNVKHLKEQYSIIEQQYNLNNNNNGHKDYEKLQQVWRDFRKDMGRQQGNNKGRDTTNNNNNNNNNVSQQRD